MATWPACQVCQRIASPQAENAHRGAALELSFVRHGLLSPGTVTIRFLEQLGSEEEKSLQNLEALCQSKDTKRR